MNKSLLTIITAFLFVAFALLMRGQTHIALAQAPPTATPTPVPLEGCANECWQQVGDCTGACDTVGQWCEQYVACVLNAGVTQLQRKVYQCLIDTTTNTNNWTYSHDDTNATSSCCGFCSLPAPTLPPGSQACINGAFQVNYKSSRVLVPGEQVSCETEQTKNSCIPCQGLQRKVQCNFGPTENGCTTALSDCYCKSTTYPFKYSCSLKGVLFVTGYIPNPVNAQYRDIAIDPPVGSVVSCQVGTTACACPDGLPCPACNGGNCDSAGSGTCNSCLTSSCTVGKACSVSSCIGGVTSSCYPDCNGGICAANQCQTCAPAGVTPISTPTKVQERVTIMINPTFTPAGPATGYIPPKAQRWVCLSSLPCTDPQAACSIGANQAHRARIHTADSTKLIPFKDTFVFECIMDPLQGPLCTTGNATTDTAGAKLPAPGALPYLQSTYNYQHTAFEKRDRTTGAMIPNVPNPFKANPQGEMEPHEWESNNSGAALGRIFLAMNEVDNLTPNPNDTTQEQQTFYPESLYTTGCSMIKWDPYGRVFDSKTLEPIAGAAVTLFAKKDSGKFEKVQPTQVLGGLQNPVMTDKTGSFSFMVPDGVYRLQVTAPGYRFPASKSTLNPDSTQIYTNIYYGGDITQKGAIEHRDIPLEAAGKMTAHQAELLSFNQTIDPHTKKIIAEGVVSHPLSLVEVKVTDTRSTRSLSKIFSDKYGRFTFKIDPASLKKGEYLGEVSVSKHPDLYTVVTPTPAGPIAWLFSFVRDMARGARAADPSAQTTQIQPLLTKLEGVAYDTRGQKLTHAQVEVILSFSNQPYTVTQTNAQGRFAVDDEKLPTLPYRLRYTDAAGTVTDKSLTDFVRENK